MKEIGAFRVGDYVRPVAYPDVVWRVTSVSSHTVYAREFHVIQVSVGDKFGYWIGPFLVGANEKVVASTDPELADA